MSPSYSDTLEQARRLYRMLLMTLAYDDSNEHLKATRAIILNEIINCKANNPKELGTAIRIFVTMLVNELSASNDTISPYIIERLISEIKQLGTMQGILPLKIGG